MLMQDLRRALRLFRLEPGFSAAAVLTLALGIGANTALFAVVEALLLRPLPVTDAERLVVIQYHQTTTGITKEFLGLGDLIDMKQRQQSLEQLAPYGTLQATLYGEVEPMRVEGLGATPEVFAALRVQPAVGSASSRRPKTSSTMMLSPNAEPAVYHQVARTPAADVRARRVRGRLRVGSPVSCMPSTVEP